MKYERYFFRLVILLHLLPLVLLPYFVTHDGAAHLHNAELLRTLLFEKDPFAAQLLAFNPQILPNWTAHALLLLFKLFISGAIAEKILVGLYIVLLPLSFRRFLLSIHPGGAAASYLIFPYLEGFVLLLGFYGFSLGLCAMFWMLALWQKRDREWNRNQSLRFSVLMLLIYFTHFFVFALTLICIAAAWIWEQWVMRKYKLHSIQSTKKEIRGFLLMSLLPLLFSLSFILKQASQTDTELNSFSENLLLLLDLRRIIALEFKVELLARMLQLIYLVLIVSALLLRFRKGQRFFHESDTWLFLSMLTTALFFILPDDILSGGVVGIRFNLLSYVFLLIWIGLNAPVRMVWIAGITSMIVSVAALWYRYPSQQELASRAEELHRCGELIAANEVLLPLDYSSDWILDNMSCYAGADRNIIVLDNYEATETHFPLIWKKELEPNHLIGSFGKNNRPCIESDKFKNATGRSINYILILQKPDWLNDSCSLQLDHELRSNFEKIMDLPKTRGSLYKRKA